MTQDSNFDIHVQQEVNRQVGERTRQLNQQIIELNHHNQKLQDSIARQNNIINKMSGDPLRYATLISTQSTPDPDCFRCNEEIIVTDENSSHYQRGGIILEEPNDDGYVKIKLTDDSEVWLSAGLDGKDPAQFKLTKSDDGTSSVICVEGRPWEVRGAANKECKSGDILKIKNDNHQIVGTFSDDLNSGIVCSVLAVSEEGVEVENRGETRLVYDLKNHFLEIGDKVLVDSAFYYIIKKLQDSSQNHKLSSISKTTWDDIGGLEEAKQQLKDMIELPYLRPDLFKHYGIHQDRGALIFGPPGCGKSLLARVCAWSIANIHKSQVTEDNYIYVKGPELLDKWVGNTESKIRALFEKARKSFRKYGYKSLLVIEEAESILCQRGTRTTSSIVDTIVPMFLSEMDGVDENQTLENPIILLLTNRPDILDPAVVRPGRISKHIKIDRPTEITALDIISLKLKDAPFAEGVCPDTTMAVAISDLYSKSRVLYRLNNEHDFTLGDASNGAMIESLVEMAKMNAIHRDIDSEGLSGLILDDFRKAVELIDHQQRGLNHSYDIDDFAERLGIQSSNLQVDRCFASK